MLKGCLYLDRKAIMFVCVVINDQRPRLIQIPYSELISKFRKYSDGVPVWVNNSNITFRQSLAGDLAWNWDVLAQIPGSEIPEEVRTAFHNSDQFSNLEPPKLQEKFEHRPSLFTQKNDEELEFKKLVNEMRPLNFSTSSDLSNFIAKNHLGKRYPHLAGVVEMTRDSHSWNFNGGISPKWYAQLCQELGLNNNHTSARVSGFVSYYESHLKP